MITPKQDFLVNMRERNYPYYVYELIDPRNMKVFYVGKGKGNRAYEHTKKVKRNSLYKSNKAKNELIQEILHSGNKPIEIIIERYATDQEAVEHEADLISEYGLQNLTNVQSRGSVYVYYDKENKGLAEAKKAVRHISKMLTYFCNPNKHKSQNPDFYYNGEKIDAHWLLNSVCKMYNELMNGKFRDKLLQVLDYEINNKHYGASRLI